MMRHRLNIGVIAAFLLMPLSLIAGSNPIEIGTLAELKAFAKRVNNGETTLDAVLTADITVSYNVLKYDGTDLRDHRYPPTVMWTSIGLTHDKAYRGTFDGQGHAINGLYGVTTKEYEHPVALFGFLNGATIKNLSIHDSYLMGGEGIWTGAIAHSSHESHITDIASAACVKGMDCACGLVGESDGDTFEHCLVVGSVESSVSGGTYGIAHTHNSTITECYTTTDDAEAIRGGGLTYYFNNGVTDGTQHWYQRIGIDDYPRDRFIEGGTVYQRYQDCRPIYTNNPEAYYAEPLHHYDVDGYCAICQTYSNPVPQQAADGYYEINNVGQLDWLCKQVNNGNLDVNARLESDIHIGSDKRLTPMTHFRGTLDGNGKTIKGLRMEGDEAALIHTATDAVIKNLNIEYSHFYGSTTAAPLVSTLNNSQIINCRALNNHLEGTTQSGLVCNVSSNSHITNCYSDAPLYITGEESALVNSYANVTEEQLHSGELAYLLDQNRPDGSDHWYQRIGTDSIPVMSSEPVENGTVYQGFVSCSEMGYTNEADLYPSTPAHRYDKHDICVFCNKYMEPTLSADGYYEIGNPGQLYWWGDYVRADESHRIAKARLMNDINIVDDMPQWVSLIEFNGTIDGQGYAIRGLKAISPNSKYDPSSFILTSTSATIRNLCMANGTFQGSNTAPFVINFNGGSMVNCSSVQNNLKNKIPSYGFVRYFNAGTIEDCFTDQPSLFQDDPQNCTPINCFIPENNVNDRDIPQIYGDGSLALRLNNGVTDGTQAWYQRLGVDTYPVAHPIEGGTVYPIVVQCRNIHMGYTNVPSESTPAHYAHGEETCRYCAGNIEIKQENGYYLLYTPGDLLWFADYVNKDASHRAAKAKIMNDIDMAGIDWTPIQEFHGELDGQGYAIKHATLYDPMTSEDKPIIITAIGESQQKRAVVKNLIISDSYIKGDNSPLFIKLMSGKNEKEAQLENCGALHNSYDSYLVGSVDNYYYSFVTGCFSDSRIVGNRAQTSCCLEGVLAEQLASGEVAYKINDKITDGKQAWYQRLGVDAFPVARHLDDGTVYALVSSCKQSEPYGYTNTPYEMPDHLIENGMCMKCIFNETPQLKNGYYEIANKGNLFWFVNYVKSDLTANAKLVCDIDISSGRNVIWNSINEFRGVFDGQNFAIKNFTFDPYGYNKRMGLVNFLNGGKILNLFITDLNYIANSNSGNINAIFACTIGGGGKVENCACVNSINKNPSVQAYLVSDITNGSVTDCYTSNLFAVTNPVYENKTTRCFCVSEEEVANGSLTHWMNGNRDDSPWYQRIGVDSYPVQKVIEGGIVYAIYADCNHAIIGYTNDNTKTHVSHKFNADGICTFCNGYQEPEWDANYADSYNGRGAYVIENPGNLLWVRENLCGYDRDQQIYKVLNKNLVFSCDIDMSNYNWSSMEMGTNVTINGQGHIIRGLNSDQEGKTALVDVCYGYIINLGIEQSRFTGENHRVTFASELRGKLLYCWSYNNDDADAMVEWVHTGASITSCFSNSEIISGNSVVQPLWSKTNVTSVDIKCGELTYFLNNGKTDGTQHWYHRLGTDNMPRPIVLEGGTVYKVTNSIGDIEGYTNTNGGEAYHLYDHYDHCTSCGFYKQPPFEYYTGYHLSTPNHLMWLSDLVNSGKQQFTLNIYLTADIDMTGIPFAPINEFSGTIDGQGYAISGLHLEDNVKTAFILKATNAVIRNLSMEGNYFSAPINASLVMTVGSGTSIYNCKALNNTHENSYQAGMIHEITGSNSSIRYCYTDNYLMKGDVTDSRIADSYAHVTPEMRKSGELTYNLNGRSAMSPRWYQRLGTDKDPIARQISGGIVYYRNLTCAEDAENGYTNIVRAPGAHTYGEDHFCTVCHNGEPAPLGEDGYYELSNDGHLMWFAHYVNLGWEGNDTIKAKLMDDITLNPRPSTLDPQLIWIPIGKDAEHPFRGEIDGQGHTITGLWIDDANRDYVGLCGYMNEALVRNIVISDAQLRGKSYVGAIAGYAYDSSILNCRVIDDSSIEAVVADGDQKSGIHAGGLIGYAAGDTQLSSSYSMAAVSGRDNSSVGGLIGMFNKDNHVSCVNSYYLDGKAPACWKYSDGKTAPTNLTFTMEQAANGQLTYRLNNEKSENVQWYQVLKVDLLPTTTVSTQGIVYPVQETCSATETTYSNIKPSNLVEHRFVMNDSPKVAGTNYYGRHCELCGFSDNNQFVIFNWDGKGSTLDVTECALRKLTIVNIPSMTIYADNIPEFNFGKLGKSFSYFVNTPIKFKREFHEGALYTVIFPFDVYEEEFKELGSFYKYSGIDQTHGAMQVNFNRVDDYYLTANVAYVFKPNKDISEIEIPETSDYGVELYGEYAFTLKPDNPGGIYGLYGTFHQMTIPYGAFGFLASTSQLARLSSTAWTRPFRAYIWLGNIDQSRISFTLTDEDTEETGIFAIEEDGSLTSFDSQDADATHNIPIYDLTGRRITRPISGHVYLRAGRKFIAK